jgi:hypothetical protein
MVKRFGKLITAALIIMAAGIVTFLLVIPLYHYFGIDTDIIGLLIFIVGLVIGIVGIILRFKPHGFWLVALIVLASLLSLSILFTIASLIYYLISGKPLGE